MSTPFDFTDGAAATTGLHYAPQRPSDTAIVLAHGAGAGQRHAFMVAIATGLAARGLEVVTFDFPYMHAGRKLPDRAPVLESCFRAACDATRDRMTGHRLVIGGKSMGGRMATHLGAQGSVPSLSGIVALGYPLHPPGRPDRPRLAHLPAITVPVLIVQGERDAFGSPDELRPVLRTMTAPVTLHVIPGGDHSFASKGVAPTAVHDGLLDAVASWLAHLP